jgi:hypothetical protein
MRCTSARGGAQPGLYRSEAAAPCSAGWTSLDHDRHPHEPVTPSLAAQVRRRRFAVAAQASRRPGIPSTTVAMPTPPTPFVPAVLLATAAKLGWRFSNRGPSGDLGQLVDNSGAAYALLVAQGTAPGSDSWALLDAVPPGFSPSSHLLTQATYDILNSGTTNRDPPPRRGAPQPASERSGDRRHRGLRRSPPGGDGHPPPQGHRHPARGARRGAGARDRVRPADRQRHPETARGRRRGAMTSAGQNRRLLICHEGGAEPLTGGPPARALAGRSLRLLPARSRGRRARPPRRPWGDSGARRCRA